MTKHGGGGEVTTPNFNQTDLLKRPIICGFLCTLPNQMSTSVRVCIKKSSSEKREGDNNLSSPHLQLARVGEEEGEGGGFKRKMKKSYVNMPSQIFT